MWCQRVTLTGSRNQASLMELINLKREQVLLLPLWCVQEPGKLLLSSCHPSGSALYDTQLDGAPIWQAQKPISKL